jgi:O-antigen/teichoic acid export membrane protein
MSGGKRLVGSALVYTLSNAISAGVPVLLLPLLTRVLAPQEYGTVAMFGVVLAVLGAFTGLSVHGAVGVRYFERDRTALSRYVMSCLAVLVASTSLMFVVAWLLLPWLESWLHLPGPWILVAVAISGSQFVIQVQLALWQSEQKVWSFAALRGGQAITDAVASLVLVLSLGFAWQGRLAGMALAAVVGLLWALAAMKSAGWLAARPVRADIADALHFGIPLIPHSIGTMLVLMTDRLLISNVLDVASTGVYLVAMQIGMVLGLLTDAANKAFSPWLMRSLGGADASMRARIVRLTYGYFVGISVFALLFASATPWLLSWLVGPEYRSASEVLHYIAMGFAFGGMYYMVTNYVFFASRTKGLAVITFAAGLFNVGATFVLLKHNGLVGAGQAFMLSQALTFLGTWWLAQRVHPMPWRLRRSAP